MLIKIFQRRILLRFFLGLLLSFLISFILAFLIFKESQNFLESVFFAFSVSFLLSLLLFYRLVALPLKKLVREMKALLTQEPYQRIQTKKEDEMGIIAHFFNQVTDSLGIITNRMNEYRRMSKEIGAAQNIQSDLLPKSLPQIDALEIAAKTRPASEMGGDAFDFFEKNGRHFLYTGDSTGHGLPAALVMVMVDVLLSTFIDQKNEIQEVMHDLNVYLKPHLQQTMFMTLILLEWEPKLHRFSWVGAGHEYVVHVKCKEKKVDTIMTGGLALGMIEDNSKHLEKKEIFLDQNDFVILYSDGIVEAKNPLEEKYTLNRLVNLLKDRVTEESDVNQLFNEIVLDLNHFMEGHAQDDDMTLIIMKHVSPSPLTGENLAPLDLELL